MTIQTSLMMTFRRLPVRLRPAGRIAAAFCLVGTAGAVSAAPPGNGISNIIWKMPQIPSPPIRREFDSSLIPVLRQVLAHSDSQMQQVACRVTDRMKTARMPGLDALAPALTALAEHSPYKMVRHAAAETLADLADPAAKTTLRNLDLRTGSARVILAIDPLLVQWRGAATATAWMKRAADNNLPLAVRISAFHSLAAVQDDLILPQAKTVLFDPLQRLALRLAAADTLGALSPDLAATLARQLRLSHDRSAAAHLRHGLLALALCRPAKTVHQAQVLVHLAEGRQPALIQGAMAALLPNDADLLLRQVRNAAKSPIAEIRLLAARILVRHLRQIGLITPSPVHRTHDAAVPAARSLSILAKLLNDRRRFVRWYCRRQLIRLGAMTALRTAVLQTCRRRLTAGGPRSARQAAMVLGSLDDQAAEPELLHAALSAPRIVRVGAVLALREIRASAAVGRLFAYAHQLAKASRAAIANSRSAGFHRRAFRDDNIQIAQIFQLIGILRWRPAATFLRTFVPKTPNYAGTTRASAIWALGRIYHRGRHRKFIQEIAARLNDISPLNPESPAVRQAAAIVLGELGKPADAATVYAYVGPYATDPVSMSCRWAYIRLTGKSIPMPVQVIIPRSGDIASMPPTSR